MPEVTVQGQQVTVADGASVLAALQNAGFTVTRTSLSGELRGALCGMGSCFNCRARVNGLLVRTCLTPVEDGQVIELLEGTQ